MKIFSKFKDYYDHVQAFGQDEDVSYIRNTQYYVSPLYHRHGIQRPWFKTDSLVLLDRKVYEPCKMELGVEPDIYGGVRIYFCGKVYHCYKPYQRMKEEYFYSPEKYESFIMANEPTPSELYDLKYQKDILSQNGQDDRYQVNLKTGCPVVVVMRGDFSNEIVNIHNPRLNEFQFQKVFEPYTAFMELDMFISGVLGKTGGEMVTISDKVKIDKHGFDSQYGFRTRPREKS